MPNNGALMIIPGTSAQAIPAGYHNGAGSVAGDSDLTPDHISIGTNVFGVDGTFIGHGVPATGETTDWGPGSDGNLHKGAPRSFTDNGDGTTTDNATGLMWENKSRDGGIHDADQTFTWGTSGNVMDGTISTVFLATLNSGSGFAGHTDWRIPNANELMTLMYFSASPGIGNNFLFPGLGRSCVSGCSNLVCSCAPSGGRHWTSTTTLKSQGSAWYIDFIKGTLEYAGKNNAYWVRAVRGG
jgi:hypothetical protein